MRSEKLLLLRRILPLILISYQPHITVRYAFFVFHCKATDMRVKNESRGNYSAVSIDKKHARNRLMVESYVMKTQLPSIPPLYVTTRKPK